MPLAWIQSPDGSTWTATVRNVVLRVEANGERDGVVEWFGQAVSRDGVTPVAILFGPDREGIMADLEAVVGA